MKFKPVPDNIRCATIDAKYIVVARKDTPDGSPMYRAFVTDSDYIYDHVILPALEEHEKVIYMRPNYSEKHPLINM